MYQLPHQQPAGATCLQLRSAQVFLLAGSFLRRRAVAYRLLLVLTFAFLVFARTRAVADTFWLMGDQIRDWRIALGPWHELPLTGPQSTAGGTSLGPVYYWVLWIVRHLIGPWTRNLPHAGAIGISVLQSAADLLLLHAVRQRTGSTWLALGATLFAATASHDMGVSATIWNPPVSVAFAKITLALLLIHSASGSTWLTVGTTMAAWFAVQAHSAALFVAAPAFGAMILHELTTRGWLASLQRLRLIVEIVLLLQLPFLYHAIAYRSDAAPTRVLSGAAETLSNPSTLRLADSTAALTRFVGHILMRPYSAMLFPAVLIGAAIVLAIRARRDLPLAAATFLPLITAVFGFAFWRGLYDEYWYLPLAPSAALTIAFALTTWRPRITGAVLVAAVLLLQPGRLSNSLAYYRMPEYGVLVRGSTQIRHHTTEVRRIETSFDLPPRTDRTFLYEILGGRVSPDAAFDAVIDQNGAVQFRAVPRASIHP